MHLAGDALLKLDQLRTILATRGVICVDDEKSCGELDAIISIRSWTGNYQTSVSLDEIFPWRPLINTCFGHGRVHWLNLSNPGACHTYKGITFCTEIGSQLPSYDHIQAGLSRHMDYRRNILTLHISEKGWLMHCLQFWPAPDGKAHQNLRSTWHSKQKIYTENYQISLKC